MSKAADKAIRQIDDLARSIHAVRVTGLDRVKGEGKKLGRPTTDIDVIKAAAMVADGMTIRQVAEVLGVNHVTLWQRLQKAKGSNA